MIESLPNDMLDLVVSHSSHVDAALLRRVSRRWRGLASCPALWRRLLVERYACVPEKLYMDPLAYFCARFEGEADAVVFYAVVQECGRDGRATRVAAEACLAPGGYAGWWRQVSGAAARRATNARGNRVVSWIEVGNLLPEHEKRVEAARGVSKLVLVTTGCDWDGGTAGETVGTFFACLAVLPVVDSSPQGRATFGRRDAATDFVSGLRDWHAKEKLRAAMPPLEAAPPAVAVPGRADDDPVTAALALLRTPPQVAHDLDVASYLGTAMAAVNARDNLH